MIDLIPKKSHQGIGKLIVDCANGVGGEKLQVLKEKLSWSDVEIRNSGKEGILNEQVGADYVQKDKVAPQGFGPSDVGIRYIYLFSYPLGMKHNPSNRILSKCFQIKTIRCK